MLNNMNTNNINLEEVVAIIEQTNASVQEVTSKVNLSAENNNQNIVIMKEYNEKVNELDDNINKLTTVGKQTNDILSSISYVSDQINLLSLNALIESARVGEQGKAFNVIANEMKKLNEKTKSENNKIKQTLIEFTKYLTICYNDIKIIKTNTEKLTQDTVIRAESIKIINSNMNELSKAMEQLSQIAEEMNSKIL